MAEVGRQATDYYRKLRVLVMCRIIKALDTNLEYVTLHFLFSTARMNMLTLIYVSFIEHCLSC